MVENSMVNKLIELSKQEGGAWAMWALSFLGFETKAHPAHESVGVVRPEDTNANSQL